ncbi:MAG: error-prone polymerase [Blastocatellia bacterium]|jgi:error-prone DNA polymerase|nr:error-prone polymerase [Blastocatellia bacterium]
MQTSNGNLLKRSERLLTAHRSLLTNYIELHARSAFSFLRGASTPEELIATCGELKMPSMALLDQDGLYGAARFHLAGKKLGVKAHIGAEIAVQSPTSKVQRQSQNKQTLDLGRGTLDFQKHVMSIPLLVRNRTGYQNLCRLITLMKLRVPKHAKPGECAVTPDELAEHAEGLICLTGGHDGPLAKNFNHRDTEEHRDSQRTAEWLIDVFGKGNVYAELQRHFNRDEEAWNHAVIEIARSLKLPLLATNGVCYAVRAQRQVADVFTCIRNHVRLETAGRLLSNNSERFLKSPREMADLFADLPEAIASTTELASRLEFTLEDLGYEFPRYPVPPGETMTSFLRRRTYEGARLRYSGQNGSPTFARAQKQIEHELALIEKLKLEGYFLIVWDIIQFCKRSGILVQGRGSAANSAVCYSLGITAVDPVGMELLFERFLSEERGEWPDIDLDLPSGDQRERAIQYVYERYGKLGAAMTANVITYRGRSAAREVGKVLGFDEETLGRLSSLVHTWEWKDPKDTPERQFKDAGLNLEDRRIKKFFQLYRSVQDLPRHLGQHSGGMVICQGQLNSVVPLEPAAMPGRVVVQWDKEDCADLGIIKVDLLGLGMMAVLEDSIQIIRNDYGEEVDLAHLPPDDRAVYKALQHADTIGMFQIESRAQMSCLPRLRPYKFYDIVVQVAIIRPGPIVGNMVNPYLSRRLGRAPIKYAHPLLEPVLKRTLGVPLFQEQLLKMAMICADFSGGEAEELRRAMGFKRSEQRMRDIEIKLRRGMTAKGIHGPTQDEVVQSIASFALYGFPESHAASFALIAYASAYLKCHYLAAFTAATLNNQPMGFYQPFTIIKDAQRHGLKVKPVDVTRSDWDCTLEEDRGQKSEVGGQRSEIRSQKSEVRGRGVVATSGEHESTNRPLTSDLRPLALRLGLRCVKGLREVSGRAIERERNRRSFTSLDDLHQRVPELRKDELRKLAAVGALNFIGKCSRSADILSASVRSTLNKNRDPVRAGALSAGRMPALPANRRDALWQVERVSRDPGPLFEKLEEDGGSPLAPMTLNERLNADLHGTGITIGRHPMAYQRAWLDTMNVARAVDLKNMNNGQLVRVAGWVIVRQRPGTAKGFVFLSLEDETGIANVIVTPQLFEKNRLALVDYPFLLIGGALQHQDNVISVKAKSVEPLQMKIQSPGSHDFH